jgi:CheY-like chemotaxis protein
MIGASTAAEAAEVIESFEGDIDALLMDINLPDGWGGTLAQALLEEHPEMVVVYTTGYASEDPILSGALNDAPYVLRKPFTSEELLNTLREAMGQGREGGAH